MKLQFLFLSMIGFSIMSCSSDNNQVRQEMDFEITIDGRSINSGVAEGYICEFPDLGSEAELVVVTNMEVNGFEVDESSFELGDFFIIKLEENGFSLSEFAVYVDLPDGPAIVVSQNAVIEYEEISLDRIAGNLSGNELYRDDNGEKVDLTFSATFDTNDISESCE